MTRNNRALNTPGIVTPEFPIDLAALAVVLERESPMLLVDTLGSERRSESAYEILHEQFGEDLIRVLVGVVRTDEEPQAGLAGCEIQVAGSSLDAPRRVFEYVRQRVKETDCPLLI